MHWNMHTAKYTETQTSGSRKSKRLLKHGWFFIRRLFRQKYEEMNSQHCGLLRVYIAVFVRAVFAVFVRVVYAVFVNAVWQSL